MSASRLLITQPPLPPQTVSVDRFPFWIGSGADDHCRLVHPSVRSRHVGVIEESDGCWLLRGNGAATIDGVALGDQAKLSHGSQIGLAPGVTLTMELRAAAAAAPAPAPAPARRAPPAAPPTRRRTPLRTRLHVSPRLVLMVLLLLSTLGGGSVLLWRATQVKVGTGLTLPEQIVVDSLLAISYEHIERGYALRELNVPDAARREFDSALAVLSMHPLGNHPEVKDRIHALAAAIESVDPTRRARDVAAGGRRRSLRDVGLDASMSVEAFAAHVAQVRIQFTDRFGIELRGTGADHAEHVSLYGKGGALDFGVRELTAEQIRFAVDAVRSRGIRVRDFSRDEVLQAQIRAAYAAGVPDRAGTGRHLHIDRFNNRRDRWTVTE